MKLKSVLKVALALFAICSLFVACDTLAGGVFPVMYESEPGKLYLLPSGNWAKGDEAYACWFWANGGEGSWTLMTAKESDPYTDGLYEVTIPEGVDNVIFVRYDKTKDILVDGWNAKWDQTDDLKIPTDDAVLYDVSQGKFVASATGNEEPEAPVDPDPEDPVEPEEPAKTVNDLTCYGGSMNGWKPETELVDGSFTFYAAGGEEFKFTAGGWDIFEAAGVVIDALDSKIELQTAVKGLDNIKFADGVLTKNHEYKVTLIIEDGKAFVKVTATGEVYTPPATNGVKYAPEAGKIYMLLNNAFYAGGERYVAYFYGDGDTFVEMSAVDGVENLYEVTVPAGKKYTNVIFIRMDASKEISWDSKWNQTGNLTLPSDDKVCCTISAWDGQTDNWFQFAE